MQKLDVVQDIGHFVNQNLGFVQTYPQADLVLLVIVHLHHQ